ncbi:MULTISPECIES: hypothetical protein [Candidatus Nitrosocaldus]|jgi:hypothetical protein|uniref:Uncharacterized protein n=1 Tax=Candidatus Nitrosocaldus cavascurensis TaxID=2058097 RepID=A0A2K5AR57_9ARCH|nr:MULTISPECIES: hypothetical protein [Candidatus Nitrosocaldus]SPC34107.1 conserved protein of unknown function [Candidatus Nitrosocaldus cavascurensis]
MLLVKIPYYMQLASINDLARLASALEVVSLPVYAFRLENMDVLAVGINVGLARPLFCYVNAECSGEFIAYRIYMGNEEINMVNAANNPAYSYAPIIRVEEMPKRMLKGRREMHTESIVMSNLGSLAKLVLYRYMREEVLTPLFLMKRHYIHGKGKDKGKDAKADGMIVVGMFMNSNEDGTPYFCYTVLDKMPEGNFVRYSSQSGEEPEFTNDIDGHGYIYMKVIRVRDQQV